jgi:hypothetical protein
MGTAMHAHPIALLANSTIKLSAGWNAFFFWGTWAVCIIALGMVLWAALRSKRWDRWTTQDILIVAALGVVLEVYDNILGDQFLKPLVNVIPGFQLLQVHDLPYMFLLMVGVALVRKPGCVTAMVFINFLLSQLLFGSGHGALDWSDGLTQAIFCDLYIVARRGKVYAPGASLMSMVIDGLMIGILRGGPNAFLTAFTFDPYLNSTYSTWYSVWRDTWSNGLANGVEAAISAALALRVARAVIPSIGARHGLGAADVDPFAEPPPAAAAPAAAAAGPATAAASPAAAASAATAASAAAPSAAADSLPSEGELA